MTIILTPQEQTTAVELTPHLFRKQLLKFEEIDYEGGKVVFDKEFATKVIASFRERVFDSVPFVLADSDNKHTRDPERARGEVVDLALTEDGLDGVISVHNDATAQLIHDNPRLGVSVRVFPDYHRADGKDYTNALQHVLGTFEPALSGLTPWEAVEASAEHQGPVIDLSSRRPTQKEGNMPASKKYSEDEQNTLFSRLELFLNAQAKKTPEKVVEVVDEVVEDEDADDELTAEELADLKVLMEEMGITDADINTGAEVEAEAELAIAASANTNAQVVELTQRLQRQDAQLRTLQIDRDRAAFEKLRQDLVGTGIPPAIVELARPLLEGTHAPVELTNGKKANPGTIIQEIFKAISTIGTLDLTAPQGSTFGSTEDNEVVARRSVMLDRLQQTINGGNITPASNGS